MQFWWLIFSIIFIGIVVIDRAGIVVIDGENIVDRAGIVVIDRANIVDRAGIIVIGCYVWLNLFYYLHL